MAFLNKCWISAIHGDLYKSKIIYEVSELHF